MRNREPGTRAPAPGGAWARRPCRDGPADRDRGPAARRTAGRGCRRRPAGTPGPRRGHPRRPPGMHARAGGRAHRRTGRRGRDPRGGAGRGHRRPGGARRGRRGGARRRADTGALGRADPAVGRRGGRGDRVRRGRRGPRRAGERDGTLGASAVALWQVQADGALRLAGQAGFPAGEAARWRHVPPGVATLAGRTVAEGEAVIEPRWRPGADRGRPGGAPRNRGGDRGPGPVRCPDGRTRVRRRADRGCPGGLLAGGRRPGHRALRAAARRGAPSRRNGRRVRASRARPRAPRAARRGRGRRRRRRPPVPGRGPAARAGRGAGRCRRRRLRRGPRQPALRRPLGPPVAGTPRGTPDRGLSAGRRARPAPRPRPPRLPHRRPGHPPARAPHPGHRHRQGRRRLDGRRRRRRVLAAGRRPRRPPGRPGRRGATHGQRRRVRSRNLGTGDVLWTDEVYALFGLPDDTRPLGLRQLPAHVHPDDGTLVARFLRTVLDHGRPASAVLRLLRPDGAVRHTRIVAAPSPGTPEDTGVRVRGAYEDVTAEYGTAVALAATRERLDEAEEESAARNRLARQLQEAIMPTDAETGTGACASPSATGPRRPTPRSAATGTTPSNSTTAPCCCASATSPATASPRPPG
ncbi:PAS domain-containing protein [Yinghuangia aomiensis]